MKRVVGKGLIWIGTGWIAIIGLLIAASVLVGWYNYGFTWVQETLSPFNVLNFLVTMIALAPGFGMRLGGEKLLESADVDHDPT